MSAAGASSRDRHACEYRAPFRYRRGVLQDREQHLLAAAAQKVSSRHRYGALDGHGPRVACRRLVRTHVPRGRVRNRNDAGRCCSLRSSIFGDRVSRADLRGP